MSRPVSREDIEQLVQAVNRLALAFDRAAAATSSASTSVTVPIIAQAGWELVEPAVEVPWPVPPTFTGVEEGVPPIPQSILSAATGKISAVEGSLKIEFIGPGRQDLQLGWPSQLILSTRSWTPSHPCQTPSGLCSVPLR